MTKPESGRIYAWRLFFPAAGLHAALVIPLSLQARFSSHAWLPATAFHGTEILTGFGLAVVAGYLLGKLSRRLLGGVFFLWLAARLAWLIDAHGLGVPFLQGMFAAAVAVIVVPRFVGRGRKWRNLSLAPLLILLTADSVLLSVIREHQRLLEVMVLLYAWLMAFMGGRLIAPAAAGARYRQGERMLARVQPLLESWLVGLLAAAVTSAAIVPGSLWNAVPIAAAAGLVALRLYRWRLWRCRGRIDLWCLGAGYAWIAVGLLLLAAVPLGQDFRTALHGLTIGAMGTLTFNVMLRTTMQRGKLLPGRDWLFPTGTLLISTAALLRLAAPFSGEWETMVVSLSALDWSTAWLILLARWLARRFTGRD